MYAGITQGIYEVVSLNKAPGLLNYTVNLTTALCKNLKAGDSIAVDGVCQTVVKIDNTAVSFQAIKETLEKTTLNDLKVGTFVSIERSLRVGDEIGGHEMSGHVFGTGSIYQKISEENNLTLVIKCDPAWMKYIFSKGFIAVNGSSLTVGKTLPKEGLFYLHLIPETLRVTNFAKLKVNDLVNIEFDYKTIMIVESVERILGKNYSQKNALSQLD